MVFAPPPNKSQTRDPSLPWFSGFLSHEDLAVVDPTRGRFLLQLRALATRRRQILTDPNLSHEDRCRQADNLALTPYTSTKPSISQKIQSAAGQVRLEDLGLTFQFAPSSKVFGFTDVELRPGGADFEVIFEAFHHSNQMNINNTNYNDIDDVKVALKSIKYIMIIMIIMIM